MTGDGSDDAGLLRRLEQVISDRRRSRPAGSYVAELFDGGHPLLSAKVIEEAYELIEACGGDDRTTVVHEAADLVFHVLALLGSQDVSWSDVERALTRRFGIGGLTEKATRAERPA